MKKLIIFVFLLFSTIAFADSSERIKELTEEAQGLINQRQQYAQEVQKIEIRIIEIQGAIKELSPKEEKVKDAK